MSRVLLVPDLPLERWPSMDKYAHRLFDWLESTGPGFEVRLAAHIGALTQETRGNGRSSGAFVRWWTQPVDPSRIVLPGPLHGPHQYAARHFFYPWRVKREAKRADLVHILDHSYAHMLTSARKRPVVVTVHDLMPVIVLRSPTDGWREGVRNRFLRTALKALRQADAYIVGTTVDRKNVPLVINTVARLRQHSDVYLLQVGGRFTGEQEQLIDRLDLRRAVRSVNAADETTLRRAYRTADVLLFPSLYEGFGFPVLE